MTSRLTHWALCASLLLNGCAAQTVHIQSPEDQIERVAQGHDRIADQWQRDGNPAAATYWRQRAEQERATKKEVSSGWLDILLSTAFEVWLDNLAGADGKK